MGLFWILEVVGVYIGGCFVLLLGCVLFVVSVFGYVIVLI